MKDEQEYNARTSLVLAVIELLMSLMDWNNEKAALWVKTANPNFGGATPAWLIMRGRSHKVLNFIETAHYNNQPPEGVEV